MNDPIPSESESTGTLLQRRLFYVIAAGVLLWGLFLAIGAIVNSEDRSVLPVMKGAVIFACFCGFLGFWGLLLWFRKPRRPPWQDEDDA